MCQMLWSNKKSLQASFVRRTGRSVKLDAHPHGEDANFPPKLKHLEQTSDPENSLYVSTREIKDQSIALIPPSAILFSTDGAKNFETIRPQGGSPLDIA